MALFKAIRSPGDLPLPGPSTRAAETQVLDFKRSYDPGARAEMAKDLAAFANALGGVIVVGASDDDAPLDYPGIPNALALEISDGFADAHARHLSPKPPVVERAIFPAPGPERRDRVILAVNVQPFGDQIIGARVDTSRWRFPIRVGTDTNDLEPAMLPLYTAAIRRNVILLENIDRTNEKVRLCFRNPRNQFNAEPSYFKIRIEDIVLSRNVVVVTLENESTTFHHIPLDDVDRVWDSGHLSPDWVVRVLGHFVAEGTRRVYHSNPGNTMIRT